MKKLLILSVCFLFGCKDMLVEKPDDRLYSKDFYKTKEDATAAINAIYKPFANEFGNRYGVLFTAISDYGSGYGFIAPFVTYQSSLAGTTDAEFQSFYQCIKMANLALKYIPDASMSEADKSYLLGEASFLRALAYRNLVRSWGPVPLHTEPVEDLSYIGGKRTPVADIYDQIIKDLKFAETNLPATQALAGKPTKWAAKVMLADIYLQNANWADARDKADEVIKSGVYSLVPVSTANDFENIFGPTVVTTKEEVFYMKFTRTIYSATDRFFHLPACAYADAGYGSIIANPVGNFIKNWDKNDLRFQFDIYTSYPDKTGKIVKNAAAQPYRLGKFKDPGYAPFMGTDYPVYRYPDALFIYAEAAAMAGGAPTALAMERLNMVHRRAYGYNPNVISPVDFTLALYPTVSAFRDLVLKERAYEFVCEDGKRWFDLVRTNTVKQVIKAEKNIDVPDFFLLFPLPVQEIDNNPDLTPDDQNPGY